MSSKVYQSIGEYFLEKGHIDEQKLADALSIHKKTGKKTGLVLREKGYINDQALYHYLEGQLGVRFKHEIEESFKAELLQVFKPDYCRKKNIAPVIEPSGALVVYISEPSNTGLINELTFMAGRDVRIDFATESAISDYLNRSGIAQKPAPDTTGPADKTSRESQDVSSPVITYVASIISTAIEKRASDIHLEVFEKECRLKYRVDGVLRKAEDPEKKLYPAIISRVKILADLDISEKRLPQDGKIAFPFEGRLIDIRVSIIPTVHGENAVLRVLDKGKTLLTLETVGFPKDMIQIIKKEASRPHGMILVTGPTGSGKTTSLYSVLEFIRNSFENKILTIEDPVEYQMAGISQVQVHADIGLTFAAGLRSFLRHDPDVIMVGEIRDRDTADIAVRASLTGHLVLSTVHTNDASSTITRFLDMGIPAYLLTSTINIIIAQRLVRKICPACRTARSLNETEINDYKLSPYFKAGDSIYSGKGCESCGNSGYLGRTPVYEWLQVSDSIKKAVLNGASSFDIKEIAIKEKMPVLKSSGLKLVKDGVTTLDEIERILSLGE